MVGFRFVGSRNTRPGFWYRSVPVEDPRTTFPPFAKVMLTILVLLFLNVKVPLTLTEEGMVTDTKGAPNGMVKSQPISPSVIMPEARSRALASTTFPVKEYVFWVGPHVSSAVPCTGMDACCTALDRLT